MFSASNYWETSPNVTAWQENLSNTAHQREMADFKAAGINPMLTAQTSGASTPSGSPEDFMSNMMDLLANTVSSSSKSMSNAVKSLSDAVKKTSSAAKKASEESEESVEKPWYDFTNYTIDNPKNPLGAVWNLGLNLLENGIMPGLSNASQFIRNSWNNVVTSLASELPDVPNSGSGKDYDLRLPLQGSHSRKHGFSGTPLERAIKDAFDSFGSYT